MEPSAWQRATVPLIPSAQDLALLRMAQAALPDSIDAHLRSVERGGQDLALAGFEVDLVPIWGPLFYVWCDEEGQDPTAADALERFVGRDALLDVRYSGYQEGPLDAIAELEQARSRAISAVLAGGPEITEAAVAHVWMRATELLRNLYGNARHGSQLDVLCQSRGDEPVHWHLDGTTCRTAADTVDDVLIAMLEAMGSSGHVIVVDDDLPVHEVRVWSLGDHDVIPLPAAEARTICRPEPGSLLVDAWGV
jgi:hypothetical protein